MAPTLPDDLCLSPRPAQHSECSGGRFSRNVSSVPGDGGAAASWGGSQGTIPQRGGPSGNNIQAHLPAGVDLSHGECACAHTEALRSWQLNTGLNRAEDGTGPSRHWTVPVQHISALKRRAPLPSTSIPHPKTPVPPLSLLQLARLRGSAGYTHTLPRPWGWGHEASFSLSP